MAHLQVGEQTGFRDNCTLRIENNGVFTIGNNCFFNNNFSATSMGSISIGNNTQIGENVSLYDANHRHGDHTQLISQQGYTISAISIGNNCWIGSNVIILKGVDIGDNTVVGAGCVLHKSVPANSIVVNHQQQVITQKTT